MYSKHQHITKQNEISQKKKLVFSFTIQFVLVLNYLKNDGED